MSREFLRLFTRLRSVVGISLVLPLTALCSVIVVAFSAMGAHTVATRVVHFWARTVLRVFGIGVRVEGEENLPSIGGGIVLFNHQSLFDIPVILLSTRKDIRFGAKIELFRVPFFGAAIRSLGTLPIVRDNRAKVIEVYKEAEARFKMNTIFALAPEGTRQKEPAIGGFKKGPFVFAMNAGVPLIPVLIKGTHEVLPKKHMTINIGRIKRVIHVRYLPPVPTVGLTHENLEALILNIREKMVQAYGELPDPDQI